MALFNRKKFFTVYLQPKQPHMAETAEFVSEGFSFRAFVFGWIWAAYQRLWLVAGVQFVFILTMAKLAQLGVISVAIAAGAQLASQFLLGLEAPNLRNIALRKRGYVQSDIVAEDSLLHAQQRYFARHATNLG